MQESEDSKVQVYLLWGLVIAVVALLLISLVFTGASCGPIPADKINTQNTAYNLKTAIRAFHTEYKRYPLGGKNTSSDVGGDSGEVLMNVLLGFEGTTNESLNPRKIVFYSDQKAKKKWRIPYTSGIEYSKAGHSAKLWDPWGNLYQIKLDTDGDKRIANPSDPSQQIPASIIVWSAGKDGGFSTWKDNVKTW